MAKIPLYRPDRQESGIKPASVLSTPQFGEAINMERSISEGLDTIQKFAYEEGERGVKKQAAEYTVANPLSIEQLEEAKVSGINPIEQAVNGGMVWNDAVTKLYAQQGSAELTNQSLKHFESVYAKVQDGILTDADEIQNALEAPIGAYRDVLSKIDPEVANKFYAAMITNGGSYYRKSLGTLRTSEQKRQDLIGNETYKGLVRQWQTDLDSDISPELLMVKFYQDVQTAQNLFTGASNETTLKNSVLSEFSTALYEHMSDKLVETYASSEEAYEAMKSDDLGAYSGVWKTMLPNQKKDLQALVKSNFKYKDERESKKLTEITASSKKIGDELLNNEEPTAYADKILKLTIEADKLSGNRQLEAKAKIANLAAAQMVVKYSKGSDIAALKRDYNIMKNDPTVPQALVDAMGEYVKNSESAFKQDPVEFELKRTKGVPGSIVYDEETQSLTISQFDDQINTINNAANKTESMLSNTQVSAITEQLTSPDALNSKTRIELAQSIIAQFGDKAGDVFRQIAPSDLIFANNGLLLSTDLRSAEVAVRTNKGASILEATKTKVSESKLTQNPTIDNFSRNLSRNPEDSLRIREAAAAHYVAGGHPYEVDKDGTIIDTDEMLKSLWAVTGGVRDNVTGLRMGGVAEINGEIVIIPNTIPTDEAPDILADSTYMAFSDSITNPATLIIKDVDGKDKSMIDETGSSVLGRTNTGEIKPYNILDLQEASVVYTSEGYELQKDGRPFLNTDGEPIMVDLLNLKQWRDNQMVNGILGTQTVIPVDLDSPFDYLFPEEDINSLGVDSNTISMDPKVNPEDVSLGSKIYNYDPVNAPKDLLNFIKGKGN